MIGCLFVGYALLATASYELFGAVVVGVTFFPPAGLTFATLILIETRLWFVAGATIVTAEMTVNVAQGNGLVWSASWAAVNLIEPVAGAVVVRRLVDRVEYGGDFVRAFALGGLIGPAVGAVVGATVQVWHGDDDWLGGWFSVWVGDGLGILVIAPVVLVVLAPTRPQLVLGPAVLGAVSAVAAITAGVYLSDDVIFGYLVIPVLAWSALRFGPATLALLSVLVATSLTSATAQGRGPWSSTIEDPHTLLVRQQIFLLVAIGGAWLLAIEGRNRLAAVRATSEAEHELEIAQQQANDAARVMSFARMLTALNEARTPDDVVDAVGKHALDVVDVDEVAIVVGADLFAGVPAGAAETPMITARVSRVEPGPGSVSPDHPIWSLGVSENRSDGTPTVADDGSLGVPLHAADTRIGAVWFRREAPWPARMPAGCTVIASLVAGALDRTRSAERDHQVASRLQRAMMPQRQRLSTARLDVAGLYRPATDALMVGGDWYVLNDTGASVTISVGDVVGHGLDAAATMGRVSSAAHALGLLGLPPCEVIALVEEAVSETPGADMTTMLQATFDPSSSTLTYCRAGHPPPLVRVPGERSEYLDGALGAPLGWAGGRQRTNSSRSLPTGSLLVCFTDGLIEWRGTTIDERLLELQAVVDATDDVPVTVLVDRINAAMIGSARLGDDVVIVCGRVLDPA